MSLTTRVGLLAGASVLTLTGASFADSPTEAQNAARIAELEATVAQLSGDNWMTEQRTEEIRGIVQDVLADADTRASLLQAGMTAGYDNGFIIGSPDGNFLLKINGDLQFRWIYNNSEGGLTSLYNDDADDYISGMWGLTAYYNAVTAQLSAAELLDLAEFGDMADARAFLDTCFAGFSEAEKDAAVLAWGITDDDGNAIECYDDYQAYVMADFPAVMTEAIKDGRLNDGSRFGFENARTRLTFSGHIVDPTWMYMIRGNFSRSGGSFTLADAYIAKDLGEGWTAMFGQFKAPILREWLVGTTHQLPVERSLLNQYYSGGYVQGVMLDYRGDQFHFVATYSDGANMANTTWSTYDTEFALTARAEYMFSGNWSQFNDFTSPRGSETGFMMGAAVHFEQEEYGQGRPNLPGTWGDESLWNNDEYELWLFTLDASLEMDGANLFGAFIYRDINWNISEDVEQIAFLVQGGIYLNEDWEIFGRFEWSDFDFADITTMDGTKLYSFDDLAVLTFGINRYFSGHNVKWTTDLGYAFDRVEFFAADDMAGWRSDTGGDDGQLVFRTQLQLAF